MQLTKKKDMTREEIWKMNFWRAIWYFAVTVIVGAAVAEKVQGISDETYEKYKLLLRCLGLLPMANVLLLPAMLARMYFLEWGDEKTLLHCGLVSTMLGWLGGIVQLTLLGCLWRREIHFSIFSYYALGTGVLAMIFCSSGRKQRRKKELLRENELRRQREEEEMRKRKEEEEAREQSKPRQKWTWRAEEDLPEHWKKARQMGERSLDCVLSKMLEIMVDDVLVEHNVSGVRGHVEGMKNYDLLFLDVTPESKNSHTYTLTIRVPARWNPDYSVMHFLDTRTDTDMIAYLSSPEGFEALRKHALNLDNAKGHEDPRD